MTNTAITLNFAITDATNPEKLRRILAVFKEANLLGNATVTSSVVAPMTPAPINPTTEAMQEVAVTPSNETQEQLTESKRAPRATAHEMALRKQYEDKNGPINWRDLSRRQQIMNSLGYDIFSTPVKTKKTSGDGDDIPGATLSPEDGKFLDEVFEQLEKGEITNEDILG